MRLLGGMVSRRHVGFVERGHFGAFEGPDSFTDRLVSQVEVAEFVTRLGDRFDSHELFAVILGVVGKSQEFVAGVGEFGSRIGCLDLWVGLPFWSPWVFGQRVFITLHPFI